MDYKDFIRFKEQNMDYKDYKRFYASLENYIGKDQFIPSIKEVIFNPPATIIVWNDNTKTIVKTDGKDVFDYETGVAMAIAKRYFKNRNRFQKCVKEAKEKYEKRTMHTEGVKP